MLRKTREEKVIEHTEETIDDLEKLYNHDGRAVIEYSYLTKEYKKLVKRSSKIISMNDNSGKDMLHHTEKLKDNVDYTIKLAKKKIMYNIEEHRKTKNILASHAETDQNTIRRLRKELKTLREYAHQLEGKLNQNDNVMHQFEKDTDIVVLSKDINSDNIKRFSFDSILAAKIEAAKSDNLNLTVAKLTINNWSSIISQLDSINSDKEKVLKMFYKFFTISLGTSNIIYYLKDNIYYIILPNTDIKQSKIILSKISVTKKLSTINFTFSIGVTQLDIKEDNLKIVEERCAKANISAFSVSPNKSNIVYL